MKSSLCAFLLSVCLITCSGPTLFAADKQPPGGKPNILLITADDLGCLLSCYGETRIRTPRLDALAAEGVRFENFYVTQSSCSPSRAALLTGRYPHQNGQYGLSHLGFRMHPGEKTLPRELKAAGYTTGIIGKLHVAPVTDFPFDWMPKKEKMAAGPTRDVRWVAEQSREFFARAKTDGKPFFYYVNFFDPHGPLNQETDQVAGLPPKPLTAADITRPLPFNAPTESTKKAVTARLFNTILRLDTGVGLLLDELKAAGAADNTIVVFLGDNGTAMPRGKTTCYEAGVRVPLIVRWPGTAKVGQVRKELVNAIDLMPTLLAAADVNPPDSVAGEPLQPLLRGESPKWREFLFTEMNFHEPSIYRPTRTVRDGRHKLLLHLAPEPAQPAVELFDLSADPGETKNLADDPNLAAARQRLETALRAWRERTTDPLLDADRLTRWNQAAAEWKKLPRVQAGASKVVKLPPGEADRLDR